MILGMIVLAGVAASITRFDCDVMSYGVAEPAKVSRSRLQLDSGGEVTDVTLVTPGVRSLSGIRRDIRLWKDSDGLNRFWPISLKTEAGDVIKLDLVQTQSTNANSGAALLISKGGDFTVAGSLAENDQSYVAVGICSENQDVVK